MFFQEHLSRIAARAAAGIVAVAALASCGGGTYQVTAFVPARILSFGDESSKLVGAQGLKYSINGLSTATNLVDCTINPLWVQVLANSYSLVYANCNVEAVATPGAVDLSTLQATVGDLVDQVNAFQSGDTFNGNDLVTIWAGEYDVINGYKANGSGDQATLLGDMQAAGATLADAVNAIAATGAKVILLTMPDMGMSPFAYAEQQRGDFDRQKLLSDMSGAFNLGLRSNILNDGSKIGLVLVDDYTRNAIRSPGSFSLISLPNQSYACLDSAPLPTCNQETINVDPSTGVQPTASFLWADPTHLAPTAHNYIGNQAVGRAHSNPF
ncbi:MAG: SGNH/GDSL hydrolase family protein [Betaproteobacteria bacterium]